VALFPLLTIVAVVCFFAFFRLSFLSGELKLSVLGLLLAASGGGIIVLWSINYGSKVP
jgi:hypothetical protein